jgi:hypothetical protein
MTTKSKNSTFDEQYFGKALEINNGLETWINGLEIALKE